MILIFHQQPYPARPLACQGCMNVSNRSSLFTKIRIVQVQKGTEQGCMFPGLDGAIISLTTIDPAKRLRAKNKNIKLFLRA